MQTITTIGFDISRFSRSTGLMPAARLVIRRQLKRRHVLTFFVKLPPCLVGIEACASSHPWSPGAKLTPGSQVPTSGLTRTRHCLTRPRRCWLFE